MAKKKNHSTIRNIFEHILLVAILSILPLAVIYIHYSAYTTWNNSTFLERHGVEVEGTVVDSYQSSSARSGPHYYVTFSYKVEIYEYVKKQQVDQATYVLNEEGDAVRVLYDPDDPGRADIKGNDYRSLTMFILAIFDLALIGVGIYVWRKSHPKKALPPPED